jgi:hypothetical protein
VKIRTAKRFSGAPPEGAGAAAVGAGEGVAGVGGIGTPAEGAAWAGVAGTAGAGGATSSGIPWDEGRVARENQQAADGKEGSGFSQ